MRILHAAAATLAATAAAAVMAAVCLAMHARWSEKDVVIVTSHFSENLEWLLLSKYPVVVCDKPGADPMPFPADPSCTLDVNRGQEASSYLKYIVAHYDRLPPHVAFIHGHEEAWHQRLPFPLLEGIDRARTHKHDFISLNNLMHSNIVSEEAAARSTHTEPVPEVGHEAHRLMRVLWGRHLQPIFRQPFPEHVRFPRCAQFIVSSRAIRRHPKEVYQRLLDMVLDPSTGDSRMVAVVMEFLWHWLFTGSGPNMCEGIPQERCTDPYLLGLWFE